MRTRMASMPAYGFINFPFCRRSAARSSLRALARRTIFLKIESIGNSAAVRRGVDPRLPVGVLLGQVETAETR
jgi:hypothetical protein